MVYARRTKLSYAMLYYVGTLTNVSLTKLYPKCVAAVVIISSAPESLLLLCIEYSICIFYLFTFYMQRHVICNCVICRRTYIITVCDNKK